MNTPRRFKNLETAAGWLEQDGPLRVYGREWRTVLSRCAGADAGIGHWGTKTLPQRGDHPTTLDKSLQNEFSNLEGSLKDGEDRPSGNIPVVLQGNKIRAIICGEGREAEARSKLGSLGVFYESYNVGVIEADEIDREQIIDTVDDGKK